MRGFLMARIRRLRVNWFWPLALLVVPGCGLDTSGSCGAACSFNAKPGPGPRSGVVFCEIEKPHIGPRDCATDEQIKSLAIRLAAGAEALVAGESSSFGLDYSSEAQGHCGTGKPELVEFEGKFPDGLPVCANCVTKILNQADALSLCVATCEDLTAPNHVPASDAVKAECAIRARLSINVTDPTFCFGGACSDVGNFSDSFVDPRRSAEPVIWQGLINVTTSGADNNTLKKNATGTNAFDAGATASQTIEKGDGYVEFTATEKSTRMAGLSQGSWLDTDPGTGDIDYGLDLFKDGCVYVFEKGAPVTPDPQDPTAPTCTVMKAFLAYAPGERFRVSVTDNFDGTATVSYAKVTAACQAHVECMPFHTSHVHKPYPFRVDTSFHDDNATLGDVVIVRIR
jgi:hypothetical protein